MLDCIISMSNGIFHFRTKKWKMFVGTACVETNPQFFQPASRNVYQKGFAREINRAFTLKVQYKGSSLHVTWLQQMLAFSICVSLWKYDLLDRYGLSLFPFLCSRLSRFTRMEYTPSYITSMDKRTLCQRLTSLLTCNCMKLSKPSVLLSHLSSKIPRFILH